ncbi:MULTISPECIES: hypothetical protein [unclassified Paenibacillus]|uniref:hypothetical protein n=1 Tax=unclassified Paenibacillus TaxID=185978 RepID=UPI00369899E8
MKDEKQTITSLKDIGKSMLKGATIGSIWDSDLTEKKVNVTPEFTTKQVYNHLLGKEKLSDQEIERLKRATKSTRYL